MTVRPGESAPPLEILAHLVYASSMTEAATLTTPRGEIAAHLVQPDGRGLCLVSEGPNPDVVEGELVCLEYGAGAFAYRLYTEVTGVERDLVFLAMPLAIERPCRRLTPRFDAPAGYHFWAFDLPGAPRLQLADISVGGAGLKETTVLYSVGQHIQGELIIPGEAPFPCVLEVRHLRLSKGQMRAGCRFEQMSLRQHGRLAACLARLGPPPN